jgi:predicted O-methyltransferase YrrM
MNLETELGFDRELYTLYSSGMAWGKGGRKIAATGLSSVNNLISIRRIIQDRKPVKTLEIGLAYGGSAATILRTLSEVHPDGHFHHTAIDPGQTDFDYAGVEIVKRSGFIEKFTLVEGSSDLVLSELVRSGEKFDLVYVDGFHIFEHVFIDMHFSLQLLNAGGIMLFDDCTDPHVAKVLRFVKTNLPGYLDSFSISEFQPTKSPVKKMANYLGYSQMKAFVKKREIPRAWDTRFVRF